MESTDAHRRRAAGISESIQLPVTPSRITTMVIHPSAEPTKTPMQAKEPVAGACAVCHHTQPQLTREMINAVANCGHFFCYECALRLVCVSKKRECPLCARKLTKIILTYDIIKSAQDVKNYFATISRKPVNSFYDIIYFDNFDLLDSIKQLVWFQCHGCNLDFAKHLSYTNMFERNHHAYDYIANHLKMKHDSLLCKPCFHHLEIFPMELEPFSSEKYLRRHQEKDCMIGDVLVQHRRCVLCDDADSNITGEYFFNDRALIDHCKKVHSCCFLCTSPTIAFLNGEFLDQHLVEKHIICPVCHRNGNVLAFFSTLDLKTHAELDHPTEVIDYDEIYKKAFAIAAADSNDIAADDVAVITTDTSAMHLEDMISRSSVISAPNTPSPTSPTIKFNFPAIDSAKSVDSKVLKPESTSTSSKSYAKAGTINIANNTVNFEQDFPGLGGRMSKPQTNASSAATVSSASVAPQVSQPTPAQFTSPWSTAVSANRRAPISPKVDPPKTPPGLGQSVPSAPTNNPPSLQHTCQQPLPDSPAPWGQSRSFASILGDSKKQPARFTSGTGTASQKDSSPSGANPSRGGGGSGGKGQGPIKGRKISP